MHLVILWMEFIIYMYMLKIKLEMNINTLLHHIML